jgi:hypothetical protein
MTANGTCGQRQHSESAHWTDAAAIIHCRESQPFDECPRTTAARKRGAHSLLTGC